MKKATEGKRFSVDELADLEIFRGLTEPEVAWFSEHAAVIDLEAGERMFERGEPADYMFVVASGVIEGYEEVGGQWMVVATTRRGEVTGMLPFSRMTHYPRYIVATEPSEILQVKKSDFPEMLNVSLEVGQRLVAEMSDRVRGDVRLEQQQEKMMALGKLSAGLAHELNNPAAAVGRDAVALSEHLKDLPDSILNLISRRLDEEAIEAIREMTADGRRAGSENLSQLVCAERGDDIGDWLDDRDVADGWRIAGTLAEAGFTVDDLEKLSEKVPAEALGDALVWLEFGIAANTIVAEIASSAERISSLIDSVKTYSHMDRSTEHKPTDVRAGLDNTIKMLSHRIRKQDITLTRQYQDDLPSISANEGELNQVWTNLIDNAIDAVGDGGTLDIVAREDEIGVVVKVIDNGPGIPEDLRHRIFDPFFTTKEIGKGTGLGLDIALRIVNTHRGHMDVDSKPGRTEMRVHLPITAE